MTIPEYDKECDCDLCTTLRNERKVERENPWCHIKCNAPWCSVLSKAVKAEREKVYDELGVLHGEAAKKFQEYMDAPPTEKDMEMSKRVYEIIEKDRIEAEKPIRKDEREKVLSLIRCFIEHEGFNCGETDAIKEFMEELRGEKR